jgi:hypothetical protein
MAQVEKSLPRKHKALSSNSSTKKKNSQILVYPAVLRFEDLNIYYINILFNWEGDKKLTFKTIIVI